MGWQLHHGHGHSHGPQSSPSTQQLTITNSGTILPSTESNTDVETSFQEKSSVDVSMPKTQDINDKSSAIELEKTNSNQLQLQNQQNGHQLTSKSKNTDHESINLDIMQTNVDKSQKTVVAAAKQRKMSVGENINVRAAFIHVVGDVVQSIGVFIAALIIYFKPEWAIVDPICTFVFSIIVLFTTFKILKDAILVNDI